ncbi:hypothetical protein R3P38DRAFT_3195259 [Favolaschia claudopus]|uniref:Uncharacterized protein n=1 Tax=Favolaschia claudopus TaxID=2862362 RepID=A0AAW0BCJ7_9AGAR
MSLCPSISYSFCSFACYLCLPRLLAIDVYLLPLLSFPSLIGYIVIDIGVSLVPPPPAHSSYLLRVHTILYSHLSLCSLYLLVFYLRGPFHVVHSHTYSLSIYYPISPFFSSTSSPQAFVTPSFKLLKLLVLAPAYPALRSLAAGLVKCKHKLMGSLTYRSLPLPLYTSAASASAYLLSPLSSLGRCHPHDPSHPCPCVGSSSPCSRHLAVFKLDSLHAQDSGACSLAVLDAVAMWRGRRRNVAVGVDSGRGDLDVHNVEDDLKKAPGRSG